MQEKKQKKIKVPGAPAKLAGYVIEGVEVPRRLAGYMIDGVEAPGKWAGYMIDGVGNRVMYQANFPASAEARDEFLLS